MSNCGNFYAPDTMTTIIWQQNVTLFSSVNPLSIVTADNASVVCAIFSVFSLFWKCSIPQPSYKLQHKWQPGPGRVSGHKGGHSLHFNACWKLVDSSVDDIFKVQGCLVIYSVQFKKQVTERELQRDIKTLHSLYFILSQFWSFCCFCCVCLNSVMSCLFV